MFAVASSRSNTYVPAGRPQDLTRNWKPTGQPSTKAGLTLVQRCSLMVTGGELEGPKEVNESDGLAYLAAAAPRADRRRTAGYLRVVGARNTHRPLSLIYNYL